MRRHLVPLVATGLLLATASGAHAGWLPISAGAAGAARAGSLAVTGETPTLASSARNVTVTWTQSAFEGGLLGARDGGYTVARYSAAGVRQSVGAGCAATISGTTPTLTCTEGNVADGDWRYSIIPVLGSWRGAEGPTAAVSVDGTAPTGSLTSPPAEAFVKGTVILTSNSADTGGSGVASVTFERSPDGADPWTAVGTVTTATYSAALDTTTLPDNVDQWLRAVTTDGAGNTTTSAAIRVTVQNAAPTATGIVLNNGSGGTAGRVDQGDSIVVTFSQLLSVSSLCGAWSGDRSDKTLTDNGGVVVRLTNNGGTTGSDTVTVTAAACPSGFQFGSIDLGSPGYITSGDATFGATGAKSRIHWDATSRTLTITLGKSSSGNLPTVASSIATYTPDPDIRNAAGTAVDATSVQTPATKQF